MSAFLEVCNTLQHEFQICPALYSMPMTAARQAGVNYAVMCFICSGSRSRCESSDMRQQSDCIAMQAVSVVSLYIRTWCQAYTVAGVELPLAEHIVDSLVVAGLLDKSSNTVSLEAFVLVRCNLQARCFLGKNLFLGRESQCDLERLAWRAGIAKAAGRELERYNNLYLMLGDTMSDEMYMKIVRNNILVDVQGEVTQLM
eukprot:6459017-Amphidinium_carterae.1